MLGHRLTRGHRLDQAVGEVPRMRGDETEARNGRTPVGATNAVDDAEQFGQVWPGQQVQSPSRGPLGLDVSEALLGRKIVSVAVDVLAEQRQFGEAGSRD